MELTSFILGVCAVIILIMVVGTFVNIMKTKSLKEEINQLYRENENRYNESEKTIGELYTHIERLHSQTESNINEIYRHVDSRVDKSLNTMSEHVSEIYRQLELTNKSVING